MQFQTNLSESQIIKLINRPTSDEPRPRVKFNYRLLADCIVISEGILLLHLVAACWYGWRLVETLSGGAAASLPSNRLPWSATVLGLLASVTYTAICIWARPYDYPAIARGSGLGAAFRALRLWLAVGIGVLVLRAVARSDTTSAVASPEGWLPEGWMLAWLAAGCIALFGWRLAGVAGLRRAVRLGRISRRRLALVGATPQALGFVESLRRADTDIAPELVGVFDDRMAPERRQTAIGGVPVLGAIERLVALCRVDPVDTIVIALPHSASQRTASIVRTLQSLPSDLVLSPDLASLHGLAAQARADRLGPLTVLNLYENPLKDWRGLAKWVEDKVISTVVLVAALPLLIAIVAAIRLESPGPVLFVQQRYGFNNRPIPVLKFRTMHHDRRDESGARQTTRDDPRVTRVGALLRRTSLDELPQFLNVLQGDMSVVGPRAHPLHMKILDRDYHEIVQDYAARHRMKPGITGLAQVNGLRGEVRTVEQAMRRVELDLRYISDFSIWLDLKIIVRTLLHGMAGKGVY